MHVARADDDNVMSGLINFADDLAPGFAADQLGISSQTSPLGGIDKFIDARWPDH